MSDTMHALRFHGREDVRFEQIPVPQPGPGEVAIRVAYNGLCGSDLHEFLAGPLVVPTEPHPLTGGVLPVVLGHEFAGVVSEVGDAVTGLEIGDPVCVEPVHRCGRCGPCLRGATNLCRLLAFHGLQARGGGLSETTVVPVEMLHRLPPDLPLQLGALVEPMAVAHHAVRRGLDGAPDDPSVLVFGAGPIGIGVWFALRHLGVEDVTVVEPAAARRRDAAGLGATVLDPAETDVTAVVLDRTAGAGVDLVYDAAGAAAAVASGLSCLGARGHLVSVGVYGGDLTVTPNLLVGHEARWSGSLAYTAEDFTAVIRRMARGDYDTQGWVSTIAWEDIVEDGFRAMAAGTVSKVLVDVSGAART